MAKNEDRIDALEQWQAGVRVHLENAATAIRDQKGSLDKLSESIVGLTSATAETRGSLRILSALASALLLGVAASAFFQWSVYSQLGALGVQVAHLDTEVEEAKTAAKNAQGITGVNSLLISAELAKLTAASTKLDSIITGALEDDSTPVFTFRGPDFALFVTLGKQFVVDTSEGPSVLSWDLNVAGIPPGRKIEIASITHVSPPSPLQEPALPPSTSSARVMGDSAIRVRMELPNEEDRKRFEKFFEGGGTISMDVTLYLVAPKPTEESPQPKS